MQYLWVKSFSSLRVTAYSVTCRCE